MMGSALLYQPVDEGAAFLRAKNLKPFVSNKLATSTRPIVYKPIKGGYTPRDGVLAIAYGFDARFGNQRSWAVLKARLSPKRKMA